MEGPRKVYIASIENFSKIKFRLPVFESDLYEVSLSTDLGQVTLSNKITSVRIQYKVSSILIFLIRYIV